MPKRQTRKQTADSNPPRAPNAIPIEQLLLAAARENFSQYGTRVPLPEELLKVMISSCPHCGKSGTIEAMFGIRMSKYKTKKGIVQRPKPHSWCKECRSSKDAHPTRYGVATTR